MWECRNDEHLNSDDLTECEICGGRRPEIRLFYTDQEIDISKPLRVHWHVEDASVVKICYLDRQVDAELIGQHTLEDMSSISKISLLAENKFASIRREIGINLPKPEIVDFHSDKPRALVGSMIFVEWNVKNARRIEITGLEGFIPSVGRKLVALPTTGRVALLATNETGDSYEDLIIAILPPCDINFRARSETILLGGSTEISWEIKNAHSARLQTSTALLEIPLKGSKLVSPTDHQNYRLLVTELDFETVTEEDIEITVIQPISIRQFKPEYSFVQKRQSTYLSWIVDNSTELTILPNLIDVTGLDKYEVNPNDTTIYTLTAKNALHSASKTCQIEVGSAPTPLWKPISIFLGVIVFTLLGWLYYKHQSNKQAVEEVYRLYHDGQKLAFKDCDRAVEAFRQAVKLNSTLPPESRLDSLNISAKQYELDGNKRCEAYGSSSPNIRYIIECNYRLAAALRGSAQPQTCK
jgi:hypothetical protein